MIFNAEDELQIKSLFNTNIAAPYVHTQVSTLGGLANASVITTVSQDSKKDWPNGILQNSRYSMFHLSRDGTLEQFSRQYMLPKFRKCKVSSLQQAVLKINAYLRMKNPFLADLGVAATLGAGFTAGSAIAGKIVEKMARKKNPDDSTIVYVEVVKLGNKWSVKAVDYAGRSRRSSEHNSKIVALRRAQELADYYHVPCHRYNPYPDGQRVFDWVKTRFNPAQLTKYRYILTDGKTVKLTNNPRRPK